MKAFVYIKSVAFEPTDLGLARIRLGALQALHDGALQICACCGSPARPGAVRPLFLVDEVATGDAIWAFVACSKCPEANMETPEVRAHFVAQVHPMRLATPTWGVSRTSWA